MGVEKIEDFDILLAVAEIARRFPERRVSFFFAGAISVLGVALALGLNWQQIVEKTKSLFGAGEASDGHGGQPALAVPPTETKPVKKSTATATGTKRPVSPTPSPTRRPSATPETRATSTSASEILVTGVKPIDSSLKFGITKLPDMTNAEGGVARTIYNWVYGNYPEYVNNKTGVSFYVVQGIAEKVYTDESGVRFLRLKDPTSDKVYRVAIDDLNKSCFYGDSFSVKPPGGRFTSMRGDDVVALIKESKVLVVVGFNRVKSQGGNCDSFQKFVLANADDVVEAAAFVFGASGK